MSTAEQHLDLQVDTLTAAGCYRVFTDTASGAAGALAARPSWTASWTKLRPGDTLVVWTLDRLGRSLRHLVDTVTALADRGVGFRSLQEAIDTTAGAFSLRFNPLGMMGAHRPRPVGRGVGPVRRLWWRWAAST